MKATIEVEPELEMLLNLEAARRKQPLEELVRDAFCSYFTQNPSPQRSGEVENGPAGPAGRAES